MHTYIYRSVQISIDQKFWATHKWNHINTSMDIETLYGHLYTSGNER